MGFFKSLFGDSTHSKSQDELPWIALTSEMQVNSLIEKSKVKPQLIFKHSTRCGISRMVLNQFQSQFTTNLLNADLYYLDLLAFRSISNLVAETFQVYHQSPQLLIIKNGVAVAHESHEAINSLSFETYS